ncbi:hypothetical protein Glove_95g75 [Diversispora epigaea]|uniref:ZSWIM1/3 RNaseH-like domain-containing protein n=1 Tax=Diversispora epigaea TaxID=1348612 RepID=A0A397JEH1_9GLOM|nr:hypothetical protein Glove_95g75 [Diversispora epigaea]
MEEIEPPVTSSPLTNLMPEEKRCLLFDVTCSLEIPMKDFDENWWPLISNIWTIWGSHKQKNGDVRKDFVCRLMKHRESSTRKKENIPNEKCRITKTRPSRLCCAKIKILWMVSLGIVKVEPYKNSPNHTHTISESDKVKRSQAVRTLVETEATKNYSPPAITVAVKEYATKLGLGKSVSELSRKEVTNVKYKIRGPLKVHLLCNSDLKSDILNSMAFLVEKGYHVENYYIPHQSTKGIVFAHPKQLEKLQHHGWLTLIDSTHKTNKYDWRLFSLYVHDTYGCWDVGAHFYVSNEDCDTISKALKIIRNYCHWSPRYILSDQSSIEAKGIKKAFPGISAGEQECKLIQDAINNCSVSAIQNYIKRNYAKNTQQWALWARQHSPLLLQVTTTNPLESYHSELKRLTSPLHSLIGAVHNVVEIDCKRRSDSERAAFNFRTKKVSAYGVDSDIIEEIHKFPFPLQHLLIKEACSVMDRIEKGKGPPGLTSLNCYCLFRVRYMLPYKHIFHEHSYGSIKLLTSEAWKRFQEMFEESGAVHNVVEIDCKRRSDSERAAFNFRTKKVSAYGVDSDIIEEIHKFPFPLQHLLIKEACSVMDRIEKGKGPPGLTSLNCYCLFRVRYMLPYKHIFHEHSYGSIKLLTSEAWKRFQEMFEESGYEIYEGRESSIEFVETQQQKEAEDRRLTVVELTERVQDKYWRVEEM